MHIFLFFYFSKMTSQTRYSSCWENFLLLNSIITLNHLSLSLVSSKFINITKIQTWLKDWISNLFHKYFILNTLIIPFNFHLYYISVFFSDVLHSARYTKKFIWEVIFSIFIYLEFLFSYYFFTSNDGTIFINKYWFGNLKRQEKGFKSNTIILRMA